MTKPARGSWLRHPRSRLPKLRSSERGTLFTLATVLLAVATVFIAHVDAAWITARSKHYGDLSGFIIIAIALALCALALLSPRPVRPPTVTKDESGKVTKDEPGGLPKFKPRFDPSGNPLPQLGSANHLPTPGDGDSPPGVV
jgi:hypothetical protein